MTAMIFDPRAAAQAIAEAHKLRKPFENLSGPFEPPTITDAYDAQDALVGLWEPERGPVVGRKIATTTKVMQDLMGINHPCGGLIYQNCVHRSGAAIERAKFINCVVECELAVRLGQDLPMETAPYSPADVRNAVGTVMAAFELIEDRNAVYRATDPKTLIADNAWNGGIVIGEEVTVPPDFNLDGLTARVVHNGHPPAEGRTDSPMQALSWVANLAAEREQPMKAGMIVITGSVVPTFAVQSGDEVAFEIDGIGSVRMRVA